MFYNTQSSTIVEDVGRKKDQYLYKQDTYGYLKSINIGTDIKT